MSFVKKYKWLILLALLLLPSLYLGVRFYVFVKPSSTSFSLSLKWRTALGHWTYERPAYQNGIVLFPAGGVFSSDWYGLEAASGWIIWSQQVPNYSFLRCLTTEHLVVSGPSSLLALKPHVGEIIWERDRALTATCSETMVFTSGSRGSVVALDLSTGQTRWAETNPREPFYGLIYNFETDELIADGAVIVDPNSGRILRSFDPLFLTCPPTDQGRGPMALIDQGQLFIASTVRSAKSGQVLNFEDRFRGFAAPTVTEDTIYIADGSSSYPFPSGVAALDRETYEVEWQYQPQHKLPILSLLTLSPVTIFDGVGYVIFSDATLRALDLETGQELGYWQLEGLDLVFWPGCVLPIPRLPNPFDCVHSSGVGIAASDDMLFVSFGDGKLYAFGQ